MVTNEAGIEITARSVRMSDKRGFSQDPRWHTIITHCSNCKTLFRFSQELTHEQATRMAFNEEPVICLECSEREGL